MSSKQNTPRKKIRMTMACERCRIKKVKCDFAHPQCTRCQRAKADCSYDGSDSQVDLFNLLQLNETVEDLQKRVELIESNIKEASNQSQNAPNQVEKNDCCETPCIQESSLSPIHKKWSLSLTPRGLRIDTDIISFQNLYDILLSGVSQIKTHETIGSSSPQSSSSTDACTILKKKPLWKSSLKTFPLYSSWEPSDPPSHPTTYTGPLSKEMMDRMIGIYSICFLCLPCHDPVDTIAVRYHNGTLDPMLANAVFAWTARHATIFHNLFPGKDPNQVGEPFFLKAKSLLKERFAQPSVDTMRSLMIMCVYAIGIPNENKAKAESEAYIYLGLAIRMCLDMKMNGESKSENVYEQERHRRYFWSLYFLETLGTIHTDKPFSLPSETVITVNYPTLMAHEHHGETRYRVEFIIHRFKIIRIYRSIICNTADEKPLLSHVLATEKELKAWYAQLPSYFKYEPGDQEKKKWDTPSFREQACIKLNFEYNFSLCQLYGLFFSKNDDEQSPLEMLSRETCLKAAHTTIELLECWVQLKQDWCHFSLECLMMVAMFYRTLLSHSDGNQRQAAKDSLEKMAKLLISSPVRHHKHVLSLVNYIKETLHISLDTIQAPLSHKPTATNFESSTFLNDLQFSNTIYTPTLMDYGLLSSHFMPFQTTNILPFGFNNNQSWMNDVDRPNDSQSFYQDSTSKNNSSDFY